MSTFRESAATAPAARALLAAYFDSRALGFPGGPDRYRRVAPRTEDFQAGRGAFLIVTVDERDVGCGGVRIIGAGDDAVCGEVKHLWIEPQSRGLGLGKALLGELEARARALGCTELVLDTNTSLAAAAGLYRTSGFEPTEPYNDNPNANRWYRKVLSENP